jgi:putative transposase
VRTGALPVILGGHRNQVWEGDHKNLLILGAAAAWEGGHPWVTVFIDDGTRVITGRAIASTPHAGTSTGRT